VLISGFSVAIVLLLSKKVEKKVPKADNFRKSRRL
jgi:hypothetical protein